MGENTILSRYATAMRLACGRVVLSLDVSAQSAAPCDRACLKGFVDGYFGALAARDPKRLPLATPVKYTENGRVLELGEGLWKTAGAPLAYRDYILDPESGGAAALTALKEYEGTAQTFVRLKIVDRRITEIETIVARVGDQRWFAPETLPTSSDIFARPVPATETPLTGRARRGGRRLLHGRADRRHAAVRASTVRSQIETLREWSADDQRHRQPRVGAPHLDAQSCNSSGRSTLARSSRIAGIPSSMSSMASRSAVATFRREGEHTSTLLLAEIFKFTGGQLREIRAVILNLPNGAGTGWTAPNPD